MISGIVLDKNMFLGKWIQLCLFGFNRKIRVIAEYKADCQLFAPMTVVGKSGGSQYGKGSPQRLSVVSQSCLPGGNPFRLKI